MQKALLIASAGGPFIVGSRHVPKPGEGQILVKILAAALNPIDVIMQSIGFQVISWPAICGLDGTGVIEEIGEGVEGFEKGDRV